MLGTSGIAKMDNVYYSNYDGSPVMWRVLDTSGNATNSDTDTLATAGGVAVANTNGLFLLSENILAVTQFR